MRADVDAQLLVERLGITARRKGRALWACCPHPFHNADGLVSERGAGNVPA